MVKQGDIQIMPTIKESLLTPKNMKLYIEYLDKIDEQIEKEILERMAEQRGMTKE
jgi:hypothetical protein